MNEIEKIKKVLEMFGFELADIAARFDYGGGKATLSYGEKEVNITLDNDPVVYAADYRSICEAIAEELEETMTKNELEELLGREECSTQDKIIYCMR